ncbi:hypothetical protein N9N24_02980, partial [Candidatus Marinimicrobia bacterium]|nr:hypothetical protein [Candidatus Neomarinimicrobiota bacterium]
LDGVTATAAELNYVDGVTSNIQTQLDAKGTGTVSSLSDLSITSTATELNILDGVTSTTGELNILDGVTATAAELNYVDGVTSNIQTQLDAKSSVTGLDGLTDVKSAGTSFSNSLIVGHQTTGTLNNANDNVGLGIGSLESITSGDNNTAIGKDAMSSNTSGGYNVGIGNSALGLNIDGHSNTGVGDLVFNNNTSGYYNVGIGIRALQASTTSGYNVAVGAFALGDANRTADNYGYNTAIGYTSGMTGFNNITTGNKNTLLGAFTALSSGAGTNQIVIGYNTYGKGDNTVTIGNGDITTWTPMDDGEVDLGSSSVEFKNLYIDGTAYLDAVDIDGGAIDGTAIGANSASTGAFTTATASTSLDITGSAGLILENDETITNSSNGTVLVTATTTSLSGDLTVTGNDITFGNGETISNSTDGTVVVTATTIEMAGKTDFDDNAITGYGADLQTLSGTSKTLAATDNGTVIVCSSGSATSISVSSGASLPAGFNCMIVQNGSGQVTFSASGTTLNARNGLKTAGQYAMMTLVHLGSNVFVVSGDTTL